MNNVNVKYVDLPCTIRAMTVRDCTDDEHYTIVLNSRMSSEMNRTSYLHEIEHIDNDDFQSDLSVQEIEHLRHSI